MPAAGPELAPPRGQLVAETFVPVAECVLFWPAFVRGRPADRRATLQDLAAVVVANLASFGLGELIHAVR